MNVSCCCSWKQDPNQRPTFRNLALYFRNISFECGALPPYEFPLTFERPGASVGAADPRNKKAQKAIEKASAKSAALIKKGVRQGKAKNKNKAAALGESNIREKVLHSC